MNACDAPSGKRFDPLTRRHTTFTCNRPQGHDTSTMGEDHRHTNPDGAILARWDTVHGPIRETEATR